MQASPSNATVCRTVVNSKIGAARMWLVRNALDRPYTIIVMVLLILLATPFALLGTPTDILPEIRISVVSVIWNYNGLPAQEVAQRIAAQSERSMSTTVNDIEHIES